MKVQAHVKMLRITPRKVRLVINQIRGQSVTKALEILDHTPKKAALPVKKLLQSAIANAVNNNGLNADELMISQIFATDGPTIKRFRPRAQGRAFAILKRTSHITIELDDKK